MRLPFLSLIFLAAAVISAVPVLAHSPAKHCGGATSPIVRTETGFVQRFSNDGNPYYTAYLCEDSHLGFCDTIFKIKWSHGYSLMWTGPRDLTVVTEDDSIKLTAPPESVARIRFSKIAPDDALASVSLDARKCVETHPIIGTDVRPPPPMSKQSE